MTTTRDHARTAYHVSRADLRTFGARFPEYRDDCAAALEGCQRSLLRVADAIDALRSIGCL